MTKICLLAGNYKEAETFARGQNIPDECWFYPRDEEDLSKHTNFYVLVIGSAGHNVPYSFFNKLYSLAQLRGQIGRA